MAEHPTEKKNFLKNLSWLYSSNVARSVIATIETIIVVRYLGLQEWGLLTVLIAYVGIINRFADFRVGDTTIKYVNYYLEEDKKDHASSVIKLSYIVDISTGILAFIICLVFAELANDKLLKNEYAFEYILVYSFTLLIVTSNSTSDGLLKIYNKFKDLALIETFTVLIRTLSVAIFLIGNMGIKGVLYSHVIASAIGLFLRQLLIIKYLHQNNYKLWISSELSLIKGKIREILWFMGNSNLSGKIIMTNDSSFALLILSYFVGNQAAGLYKIARSASRLNSKALDPLQGAIYPSLVKLFDNKNYKAFLDLIRYSSKNLIKITLPVLIIVILFAELIIDLFFGAEYVPAANAMRMLAAAAIFTNITFWVTPTLMSLGKPGTKSVIDTLSAFSYIVALIILVSDYSYNGVAFSVLIRELMYFIFAIFIIYRYYKRGMIFN